MDTAFSIAMKDMGELIAAAASPQSAIDALQADVTQRGINAMSAPYNIVGDGATDCTAGLQAALNDGAGSAVMLPGDHAVYLVSAPLTVKSGTDLFCPTKGGATIKASATFPAGSVLLWNETRSGSVDTYYDRNISITNIVFDGNNNAGRTNSLVAMLKARDVMFEGCSFQNTSYMGVSIGGCFNVKFKNCYATKTGNPVVTEEGGAAIWVANTGDGSKSKLISIDKCIFEGLEWSGIYFMPDGGVISNCDFINVKEGGVFSNNTARRIRYLNNYINGVTRKYISSSGIETGGQHIIAKGNQIYNCQDNGFALTDVQNAIISENTIFNNGQDNAHFVQASGIAVITTVTTPNQPRNIKLHANRIGDDQTVKTQVYGIAIDGPGDAVDYVESVDNNLNGNKTSSMYVGAGKLGTGSYTLNNVGHASANPKVTSFQAPTVTGNYSVTGIGFKPRMLQLVSSEAATTRSVISTATVSVAASSANFASSDGTNATSGIAGKAVALYAPAGTLLCEASFVSMDQDGFTLNFTNVTTRPWITVTALP